MSTSTPYNAPADTVRRPDASTHAARHIAHDQQLITTGFSIPQGGITGTQITIDYDTMPGNQPSAYGDTIFLWQTSAPQVPTGLQPQSTWPVPTNQPNGSNVFGNLQVTNEAYLLAFAVGPALKNICATVFVPAIGAGVAVSQTFQPTVQITNLGSTSVAYSYSMPPGTQPQTDGDWVGLWQGQGEAALYTVPPTWFAPVPQNAFQGYGALNNVSILRGVEYTLGYFKGGYKQTAPVQSTLACSLTMTN
jgi:hypothetical protein